MIQTRLCAYFHGACRHSSRAPITFDHLSEKAKDLIYSCYFELPNDSLLYLEEFEGAPVFTRAYRYDELESYASLRHASRAVNADVTRYLASQYPVLLRAIEMTPSILAVLARQPWDLLGAFRSLTLVMNGFTHEPPRWRSRYPSHDCHTNEGEFPICGSSVYCKGTSLWTMRDVLEFLPMWKRIITRLSRSSHVAGLELNLICDVEDPTAAKLILNNLGPPLQIPKCSIRLHPKPSAHLEDISRDAVLRVTGSQPPRQPPFRYLDLPTELRLQILEYTDLVTPFREVLWKVDNTYRIQRSHWKCVEPCSNDAFCGGHHAVYPVCFCWRPPFFIFLVCRVMLQDARTIFYRSNRIVIVSSLDSPELLLDDEATLPNTSIFFDRFDASSLLFLRRLRISLCTKSHQRMGIDIEQVLRDDWVRVLQHVERLDLVLDFRPESMPDVTNDLYTIRDVCTSIPKLIREHKRIVRPLKKLKGLDSFFVYVSLPYWKFDWEGEPWHLAEEKVQRDLWQHEKELEAIVMGGSYDSAAIGKMDRKLPMPYQ